jgi:hypothetical protein
MDREKGPAASELLLHVCVESSRLVANIAGGLASLTASRER